MKTPSNQFVNRVPKILGQRAENGVFRVALQGTVSNHLFQITIINDQGCRNGRFGKRSFCPLPKTGGFDENWRKF